MQILGNGDNPLCDPWPLHTFPPPEASVEHLRILVFTCAGGNESIKMENGTPFFLSLAGRHRLLARGLSFNPDVVIANGDHVYWDQATSQNKPPAISAPALRMFEEYGFLDRTIPALGTTNEAILTGIVDPQIAHLYGVRLRSVPAFMLTDDHDLFENDEASDELITLPPDRHMLDVARSTQYLYYPEFLADASRSPWLAGSSAPDRVQGLSEVFGTLRYGRLLEALMYDTKRYCTIKGPSATVMPLDTEQWLRARTSAQETDHLMHVPSTPIGWSAGKWGEWYPDVLQKDGTLGIERPKPYWPAGWWSQHQRVLQMLHAQKQRIPLIVSGDLHAFSSGTISKSGSLDLSDNPVHSLCVGPLGSSGPGFPSFFRGTAPQVPSQLVCDESFAPLEKNGFTLIDVTRSKIRYQMFAWGPPQPLEEIDSLKPVHVQELSRAKAAA